MALLSAFMNNAIPSNRFTIDNRTYVAESSDLRLNLQQQIYDDAIDVGIAIRGNSTGRTIGFVLAHTEEREGDILWWEYSPITESIRKYPDCAGIKVKIFND